MVWVRQKQLLHTFNLPNVKVYKEGESYLYEGAIYLKDNYILDMFILSIVMTLFLGTDISILTSLFDFGKNKLKLSVIVDHQVNYTILW